MNPVPRVVLIALIAIGIAACRDAETPRLVATSDATELPPLAAPRAASVPKPIESTLANGLRIVVLPRRGSGLVVARLVVLSGSAADPPGHAGLATFAATLLTRGSAGAGIRRSAVELAAAAEALGGTLEASAGWDATQIGLTVTTPRLAAALDLLAQTVRHPAFATREIERLRSETLDQIRLEASDPATLAQQVTGRAVYGAGSYGHPPSGTPRSLARIGAVELRALHRRHYRPERSVLLLSGDLDSETGAALAAQVFGNWMRAPSNAEPTRDIAGPVTDPPNPANPPAVLVVDMPDAGQAAVMVTVRLPAANGAVDPGGIVANAVLGGGYSSRLNQEIRIRRGLSYGAASRHEPRRDGGLLSASVQTRNDAAADVVELLLAEFARLADEPVPAQELTARKAAIMGRYGRDFETGRSLAALATRDLAVGHAVADLGAVMTAIDAVDARTVQAWARAHLRASARHIVVVGDARQFVPVLAQRGFAVRTIPGAGLDLDSAMPSAIHDPR